MLKGLIPLLILTALVSGAFAKAIIVPKKRGEAYEFVFRGIKPGSFFTKLGLRSNDRVIKINGKALDDVGEFGDSLKNLKTLDIIRKGKMVTLKIDLDSNL